MNFDYVYEKYFKDVYVFILSLTSNQETAQEITQETFFKALKAIDRFDGSKDILAWLFTIARNTYYTHLKKQSKISDVPQDENRVSNEEISIEEKLINEEDAFLIHEFIHTMKEPYKEVFNLRVFGELSFEKIGKLFGKSPGWARVTYYRAKIQIQEYMEVKGHE